MNTENWTRSLVLQANDSSLIWVLIKFEKQYQTIMQDMQDMNQPIAT